MHSGRAILEHTQGSSGLKMINREPWIEVTGIEMSPGSLPSHQQQGRHFAQLETRGKVKKQRCSLNSSAGEGESLTHVAGLFGTLLPPSQRNAVCHGLCPSCCHRLCMKKRRESAVFKRALRMA